MLNPHTTAKNQRTSKFLGNRRRRIQNHTKTLLVLPDLPQVSEKEKKSDIYCKQFREGFYQVRFKCNQTGRTAIGYGADVTLAMINMDKNFTEKYL
ncbi:hypothetical protein [Chryseobacterium terrae]|uniref:Transposase n=1 Tax=Chryseobacterium terrae TaxID=3163299 RepID=A0ABW8Y636_9FLAO